MAVFNKGTNNNAEVLDALIPIVFIRKSRKLVGTFNSTLQANIKISLLGLIGSEEIRLHCKIPYLAFRTKLPRSLTMFDGLQCEHKIN